MKLIGSCAYHGACPEGYHAHGGNHCAVCGTSSIEHTCSSCIMKERNERWHSEGICDCRSGFLGLGKRECDHVRRDQK